MNDEPPSIQIGASLPPPPPSPALREAWSHAKPVKRRRPGRALFTVAAVALLVPLYSLAILPLRSDLATLPRPWVLLAAIIWASAFVVSLVSALLPPRHQVLPNPGRASRVAIIGTLGLVAFGLLFTQDGASTIVPETSWGAFSHYWRHCIGFGLRISAPVIVAGWLALRRLAWVGRARLGMAIGAAGGALAGLTLHGICPFGGVLHVGLAHGGGMAVGAALGGLLFYLLGGKR